MLTDPAEIEIITRASQANVRDPTRSRRHFEHIFEDFLAAVDLSGHRLLDIGPGQYDFGVMARERGATVVGIDRDPAVLELGRHKGFDVIDADFRTADAGTLGGPYDTGCSASTPSTHSGSPRISPRSVSTSMSFSVL